MGSHCVTQAGLNLLDSNHPPTSACQSVGITGGSHGAQPRSPPWTSTWASTARRPIKTRTNWYLWCSLHPSPKAQPQATRADCGWPEIKCPVLLSTIDAWAVTSGSSGFGVLGSLLWSPGQLRPGGCLLLLHPGPAWGCFPSRPGSLQN